jgi:uncharacterized protein
MKQPWTVLFAVVTFTVPAHAAGPSFNCLGVSQADERTICASAELSALELKMTQKFEYDRDNVNAGRARQLGKSFLQERRNCKSSFWCIKNVLSSAIQAFEDFGVPIEQASDDLPPVPNKKKSTPPPLATAPGISEPIPADTKSGISRQPSDQNETLITPSYSTDRLIRVKCNLVEDVTKGDIMAEVNADTVTWFDANPATFSIYLQVDLATGRWGWENIKTLEDPDRNIDGRLGYLDRRQIHLGEPFFVRSSGDVVRFDENYIELLHRKFPDGEDQLARLERIPTGEGSEFYSRHYSTRENRVYQGMCTATNKSASELRAIEAKCFTFNGKRFCQ